jgi:acyl-CoA thioester hydrolase
MSIPMSDNTAQTPAFVDTRVRVRYAETDQMGVVYHANYFIWMEVGRVEYYRARGARYRDLEKEGILLAVVEASCRYIAPALYDEEILIRTRIEEANPRKVRFGYELSAASDGRRLAQGSTVHVFMGPDRKARKLPDQYHQLFGVKSGLHGR